MLGMKPKRGVASFVRKELLPSIRFFVPCQGLNLLTAPFDKELLIPFSAHHGNLVLRLLVLEENTAVPFHFHPYGSKEKIYIHQGGGIIKVICQDPQTGKMESANLVNRGDSFFVPSGAWHAVYCSNVYSTKTATASLLIISSDPGARVVWHDNKDRLVGNKHLKKKD